jgi:amino acid adenylation domain-containing protein
MGVLFRELSALYGAYREGGESPLAELPVQYADYAVWQRRWLQGEALERQVAYWRRQLADGSDAPLELPADRPRPLRPTSRAAAHSFELGPEATGRLRGLARAEGATLFMALLAGLQAVLARYTGRGAVAVGAPVAGRTRAEVEGLIGFFVNTLVMRTDVTGDPSFRELLGRVREVTLGAYQHQDVPFERLVEELAPGRDLGRTPLFQVMLAMQNTPGGAPAPGGLRAEELGGSSGWAKFDLTLGVEEDEGGGLSGALRYREELFEAGAAGRMAGHLRRLLEAAVAEPGLRLSELPLLTEAEQRQVLEECEGAKEEYGEGARPVHEMFERQAALTPDAVAVSFEGARLSYAGLNARAERLARRLRSLGVGPEQLVGVYLGRTPELVVALLAALKAGAAYLPLSTSLPPARLSLLLAESMPAALLTLSPLAARLPGADAPVLCLDEEPESLDEEPGTPPGDGARELPASVAPESAAYCIYTSGSTGRPKGVVVEHRQIANYLLGISGRVGMGPGHAYALVQPPSVDASQTFLFGPLITGGALHLVGEEVASDAPALSEYVRREGIEYLKLAPSHLAALGRGPGGVGSLLPRRWLMLGGEASGRGWAEGLAGEARGRGCRVLNHYGPTEATVAALTYEAGGADDGAGVGATLPVGRPLPNVTGYVLDAWGRVMPAGAVGELYLGGAGVARGYLSRPALTAERFLPDPFSLSPGARLYRTGDLARRGAGGEVEYVGRGDDQVKVSGFRVELGEVEATLARHAAVGEAAVAAREGAGGERRLVAYVVPSDGGGEAPAGGAAELRAYLREWLPHYMMPSEFVFLSGLPRTAHGKVERGALPMPGWGEGRAAMGGGYLAPRNELERKLVGVWEEVLGVKPVGVSDNFFDLGGHSMLAVRLMARIAEQCGRKLPLATIFQRGTIEHLAELLRDEEKLAPWSPLVPLQPRGAGRPFFCVHAVGGTVFSYSDLSRSLGEGRPFYALQAEGIEGGQSPRADLEGMAARYVEAVRAVQPAGPYLLGGWSMGGSVAFEMARQLKARGEEVALLALFDSRAPAGSPPPAEDHAALLRHFAQDIGFWSDRHTLEVLSHLDPAQQLVYIMAQAKLAQPATPQESRRAREASRVGRGLGGRFAGRDVRLEPTGRGRRGGAHRAGEPLHDAARAQRATAVRVVERASARDGRPTMTLPTGPEMRKHASHHRPF